MTNRTRRLAVATALLVALLVPAGSASAKAGGNGNGNGRATAPGQVRAAEARGDLADDDADNEADDANGGGRPAVPPGLADKGERPGNRPEATPATGAVPPGWARAAKRAETRPATLTGTVASEGTDSITVTVKGGHPLFRLWVRMQVDGPTTVTVELADGAVVKLDDAPATLGELTEGDHVSIRGTFVEGTVTATRVNASTPDDDTEAETD
jgi:hypothetical protein